MKTNQSELELKQIEEGVARMRFMRILYPVIREFKAGKLNKSEFGGILYWLDEKENAMVKAYEAESGNKVYHVIKNYSEDGDPWYTCLYVSGQEDRWSVDMEDLSNGEAIAWCVIGTDPNYGETGYVGVRPCIGGLKRTY